MRNRARAARLQSSIADFQSTIFNLAGLETRPPVRVNIRGRTFRRKAFRKKLSVAFNEVSITAAREGGGKP
jgi:hypothetical protein